jgi:SAM-dependent methyltransferase
MSHSYYRHVRSEIAPLLPPTANRILDAGCGAGVTSAWLKTIYPNAYTIGLEGNAELQAELARNVDETHIVNLNDPLPNVGAPDLVLLLDVLEHLPHPEQLLARLVTEMSPEATVIVSLPNVAHLSVAARLFLFGRFDYRDEGILDRTHMRFFYKDSALALLRDAGLEVVKGLLSGLQGRKARLMDCVTLGLIRHRLTVQYLFAARRLGLHGATPTVVWRVAK